ncbi:unnamed protein product [Rotaria sordida]|uniref:Uncharacterized protein n=1 Tax=Rotaria sordida TaxID=392033 RepID=A0A819FHT1_9BILA|nr:unnamed protein product [Rotaria sordida]
MTIDMTIHMGDLKYIHPSDQSKNVELLKRHGEVVEAELENIKALEKVCEGVHTVLHLAAKAHPEATWDQLYGPNIQGPLLHVSIITSKLAQILD